METIVFIATCLGLGAIAGILAGLLGVGGGLVMVPGLYWILSAQGLDESAMHIAVATSMAVIIPTGFMSARSHAKRGGVDWALWRKWLPGVLTGVVIGTLIANGMPKDALRIFFGVMLILLAAFLLWTPHEGPKKILPQTYPVMIPLALVIGVVSAMVGIGGATLSVPTMRWMNKPMPQAIGTASALGVAIAILACIMYLVLTPAGAAPIPGIVGSIDIKAAACLAIASMPLAPLGARLTHTLPVRTLKFVFAAFMVVVALKLLSEGIS
jgi:uncharacterized membrane protein YfcA